MASIETMETPLMAETIKVDIPHKLGRAAARTRIDEGFGRLRQEMLGGMVKFEDTWDGDHLDFRARVMGQTVTGRLDVLDEAVHVEVDLPMMLAAIAEKLKGKLRKEGQILLEKK
jgi:putative polyhydroxyalkanoate system protein